MLLPVKMFDGPLSSQCRQFLPPFWIVTHIPNLLSEVIGIQGIEIDGRFTTDLPAYRNIRGDNREPTRHCLHERIGKGFSQRGEKEKIALCAQREEIGIW